jgi:hypothetical protein
MYGYIGIIPVSQITRNSRDPGFFCGHRGRFLQYRSLVFPWYATMAAQPRRTAAARPAFLPLAKRSGVVGRLLPKWVAELDLKLQAKHPELFDGSRDAIIAMLEVVAPQEADIPIFSDTFRGVSPLVCTILALPPWT